MHTHRPRHASHVALGPFRAGMTAIAMVLPLFGLISCSSSVYLGGYTGFSLDATSAVVTGDNVVAVQLNNSWNAQLAPRGGDHQFSGGIYRDVNLVATDPLHVAWYGTYVTTPTISASSATVNVKTELRNDYATDKNCTLKTDILDAKGATVTTVSSTQVVPANSSVTVD